MCHQEHGKKWRSRPQLLLKHTRGWAEQPTAAKGRGNHTSVLFVILMLNPGHGFKMPGISAGFEEGFRRTRYTPALKRWSSLWMCNAYRQQQTELPSSPAFTFPFYLILISFLRPNFQSLTAASPNAPALSFPGTPHVTKLSAVTQSACNFSVLCHTQSPFCHINCCSFEGIITFILQWMAWHSRRKAYCTLTICYMASQFIMVCNGK